MSSIREEVPTEFQTVAYIFIPEAFLKLRKLRESLRAVRSNLDIFTFYSFIILLNQGLKIQIPTKNVMEIGKVIAYIISS